MPRDLEAKKRTVPLGTQFDWMVGEETFTVTVDAACPQCGQTAVCSLPPPLLAQQTDGTTHVCNPIFGGCNHGFALT